MNASQLYKSLAEKTVTAEDLARQTIAHPEMLQILVDGLAEPKAEVKYGCAKVLRIISDAEPELLYPDFDRFSEMLHHTNKIFQWQAIYVLARLAGVDEEGKFEAILDDYFTHIEGPVMVTAANSITGAALIVRGQPRLADQVVQQIFRGEQAVYESPECHEIVCGTALKTFYKIRKWVSDLESLYQFAQRHLDSPRDPTRKAAEKFIARYEKEFAPA
jgi:hypothetical protein